MIHFKTCRWKNFLSTGNEFIEIQLDRTPSTLIVGQNGAGKSTLLDLISGLQIPSEGNFKLNDKLFSPFLSETFPNQHLLKQISY